MRKMLRAVCFLLVMSVVAVGAAAQEDDPITTRSTPPDANTFTLDMIVSGLQKPLYLTHAGDGSGRLFILEQTGQIRIMQDGVLLDTLFADFSDVASQDVLRSYSERGLLGMAFHPDFSENGKVYVNYTDAANNHATRVVEFTIGEDDPNQIDRDTARVLLTISQPYANHNGGQLAFGPDGYLYISVGDGGSADDPLNTGQNPSDLMGSLLRIDVDAANDAIAYGIPEDNPAYTQPEIDFAPEVWAWGLRNVWRFSFDRATGDLYIGEVGQNAWEEINFQAADSPGGENYGWPAYEASQPYIGEPASDVVMPIAEYSHSGGNGCSVTGGYVYRGEAIPELEATYLFSDYCTGRLWGSYRDEARDWQTTIVTDAGMQVSSFGEDEAGELYLVNYAGSVWKLVPRG